MARRPKPRRTAPTKKAAEAASPSSPAPADRAEEAAPAPNTLSGPAPQPKAPAYRIYSETNRSRVRARLRPQWLVERVKDGALQARCDGEAEARAIMAKLTKG